MSERVTVLITDDHRLVREGVRAFLEIQPDLSVVGEAASGEEAVRLSRELVPDIVLMDLVMPGMGGVEATRQGRLVSPRTQVIVLSSYHEDEYIFPALRAGALSYVLKDTSPEELAETIRRAAKGESVLHPRVSCRRCAVYAKTRRTSSRIWASANWRCCASLPMASPTPPSPKSS